VTLARSRERANLAPAPGATVGGLTRTVTLIDSGVRPRSKALVRLDGKRGYNGDQREGSLGQIQLM